MAPTDVTSTDHMIITFLSGHRTKEDDHDDDRDAAGLGILMS